MVRVMLFDVKRPYLIYNKVISFTIIIITMTSNDMKQG